MTTDLYDTLAALREKYPEDVKRIEEDQKRVGVLLRRKEYANDPTTKELLAACRRDIVWARMKLAYERFLEADQVEELWTVINGRTWYLQQVAVDFDGELKIIQMDLQAELAK